MTKKILCLSAFLFITLILQAQDQKTEAQIQLPIIKLFEGISQLDDDAMRAQVTTDYVLIEDGKIWTIDSLINVLKPLKNTPYTRINKFIFLKTEYKDDMAWVYYDNSADITSNNRQRKAHWLESAVLVKQRGEWKIKFMHVTRMK